jgi:hypothetical protein
VYTCTGESSGSINQQQIQLQESETFLTRSLILSTKSMSQWTIVLLIAISMSVCVFTFSIILFVCWKCKKLETRYKSKSDDAANPTMDSNRVLLVDDLTLRDDFTPRYAFSNEYGRIASQYTKVDPYYYDDILQMSLCGGTTTGFDTSDANLIPKSVTATTTKEQLYATIRPKYMQYHSNNHDQMYSVPNVISRSHFIDKFQNAHAGSATSLDEEDLNDLKDFEDVTFDNLNKPCRSDTDYLNSKFSNSKV